MKKNPLIVILSLFISPLLNTFADDIDDDDCLVIPKVENGSITMDAAMTEEAWSYVLTSEFSDSSTIDDYYALLLYDDSYLYLYFNITDDWLDFETLTWNTDAIEIYVDEDNSKEDSWDNIDDRQVTAPLAAESIDEWVGIGPTAPYPRENIEWAIAETDWGWDAEIALPVEDFMLEELIGFDVALNDADETQARENQIWFQDDGAWDQPSAWGCAFFSGVMVGVGHRAERPESFSLGQNYPYPFNPGTIIPFTVEKNTRVEPSVYDLLGRKIETLVDDVGNAGEYHVQFDASGLPSGVYYYKIVTDTRCLTKKNGVNALTFFANRLF